MIRNVVFDFGGVLFQWYPQEIVESFTSSTEEQNLLLTKILCHPDWLSLDRGTMLLAESIPKFSARTGISEGRIEDFLTHVVDSLVKIDETEALLYQIAGYHYALYYLTNMNTAFFETLSERNGFISLFLGGIVSANERMVKPEPDIFHQLRQQYNLVPAETLFIDDTTANIETAQALGFQTVLFTQTPSCFENIRKILNFN
ncbi:HAD family hydrolase [Photobacterium atrarenae]|uniref:HAD family phosphatase n=1 Tax=Photobacterium atrarenae TaxID=865757 RepID=A0ABY5GM85_9GAMM|nr:HAD family phosphatase [Photobacterium atrarenae]UTV30033.1 HAD family phosphatase [Photobacterium atrarenae]